MMIKTQHRQALDLTVLVLLNSRFRHEKHVCGFIFVLFEDDYAQHSLVFQDSLSHPRTPAW